MSPSVSRRWHRRRRRASARAPVELPAVVVAKLRSGVVVLDAADDVALSNPAAREMGLVRGDRVVYRELRDRGCGRPGQRRIRGRASLAEWRDLRDRYTSVIVTHTLARAARVSDHTALLSLDVGEDGSRQGGVLVEHDTTARLFEHPRSPRTEAYIAGRSG